jgi:hypothetical protein
MKPQIGKKAPCSYLVFYVCLNNEDNALCAAVYGHTFITTTLLTALITQIFKTNRAVR